MVKCADCPSPARTAAQTDAAPASVLGAAAWAAARLVNALVRIAMRRNPPGRWVSIAGKVGITRSACSATPLAGVARLAPHQGPFPSLEYERRRPLPSFRDLTFRERLTPRWRPLRFAGISRKDTPFGLYLFRAPRAAHTQGAREGVPEGVRADRAPSRPSRPGGPGLRGPNGVSSRESPGPTPLRDAPRGRTRRCADAARRPGPCSTDPRSRRRMDTCLACQPGVEWGAPPPAPAEAGENLIDAGLTNK